eukprot:scaffold57657_cov63-Phaeocystis_antarctica.AAC.5
MLWCPAPCARLPTLLSDIGHFAARARHSSSRTFGLGGREGRWSAAHSVGEQRVRPARRVLVVAHALQKAGGGAAERPLGAAEANEQAVGGDGHRVGLAQVKRVHDLDRAGLLQQLPQ